MDRGPTMLGEGRKHSCFPSGERYGEETRRLQSVQEKAQKKKTDGEKIQKEERQDLTVGEYFLERPKRCEDEN